MVVSKEDILKAKEKLGDDNAYLMANLLNLEKWDEKNFKACCPYHDEKTPSFIYNRRGYYFKCFGCGKTVDLIDIFMEQGDTFLEATKKLFDAASIDYSFGEKDVKTKKPYNYPHEEPFNERQNVIEYFGKRGISKNVLDYLDIREDEYGNCVFNYYDTNDVLTMVKYRPSHTIQKGVESKCWGQKNASTSPLLFNMNRINTSKPLLICEGECDCMSAIEAGYTNSVSVPFGAQNLQWIEENWDWLNEFDSIIVWSDNDEPGIKMRNDCIYRLGSWRTKYVNTPLYYIKKNKTLKIPIKDANDCLQVGGKEFVMSLIGDAKDVPIEGVVSYSDIEELDVSQMEGVKTGIRPLDSELSKLFYGTLTILSGRPGSGKTSLLDQIIAHTIDDNKSVFLFSKEMPERMTANWLNIILAGQRNLVERTSKDGDVYYVVPRSTQKKIQSYYSNRLFIYKDNQPNDADSIINTAEECVRKFGCKLIILDNMMMIDLRCSETERNTAQTDLINRLIEFSVKFNVATILCCHPRKTQMSNTDIELYEISGSANIVNLTMRSLALRRVSKNEKEDCKSKWGKYDVVLTIIKDRILGKTDNQIGLWYDLKSRRFYTDKESLFHQYKWDDNTYTDELPYVDRLADSRFPDS